MHRWATALDRAFDLLTQTALVYVPRLAAALLLLLLGWVVARLLRLLSFRLLGRLGRWSAVGQELKVSGVDQVAPRVGALLVFWLVFLLFVAAAGQVMGLAVITAGLSRLAQYLPNVLFALLVVVAGVVVGNLARTATVSAARSAGMALAGVLGESVRIAVLSIAAMIALEQLGIASTVLVVVVALAVGGMVGGAALAFGLGSRTSVSNLIGAHYLARHYRPGQLLRVGDVQGRISQVTGHGVIVETDAGRAWVPAKLFQEQTSVLLDESSEP